MSKRSLACLLLALAAGGAAPSDVPGASDKVVFIGSVGPHYAALADPAISSAMLRTGRIGLYQHANGNAALTVGQRSVLWATWLGKAAATATVAEVGGGSIDDAGYLALFDGRYPAEVNINMLTNSGDGTGVYQASVGEARTGHAYGGYTTKADFAAMKHVICSAARHGVLNAAIIMTPNGGAEDLDDGFEDAKFWANVRAAALFGGGIGLDVPPTYWTLRDASYGRLVIQMLAWATQQGIRSSLIVSPYAERPDAAGQRGGCGYDPAFAQNTARLVADLKAAHALPAQWVVENYGANDPACKLSNDIAADAGSGSLNAVALSLADPGLTSGYRHRSQQWRDTCDAG